MPPWPKRAVRSIAKSKSAAVLGVACVAVTLYVVIAPLASAHYPPITDLPFHAAHSSILRHYWDPAWHFHEQFVLRPIAVPYMLHYGLGALLMLVLPTVTAVKAATAILLLMMPAGMALLLHGMRRSPMGALLSLPFVYCALSHWGFVSFVAALGLFAAAVGLAMLTVEKPTALRSIGLAISLVLLFFSHIFRFPMGIAAVIGAAIFLYPATRRFWPIVPPMVPSLVLFAIWLVVRPPTLETGQILLRLDLERRKEILGLVFDGFTDAAEGESLGVFAKVAAVVVIVSLAAHLRRARRVNRTGREVELRLAAWLVVAACTLVFLGLFFTLPMQIGTWWYVYPREITAAAFLGVALLPGLPRAIWIRAPMVIAIAVVSLGYGRFVASKYAEFDRQTADFREITSKLPQAPRLLYLIYDHAGSTRTVTPFVHLPAWSQAERGGFLSFNFIGFGAAPIAFRAPDDPSAVLPPKVPLRWEWNAHPFKVLEHGAFFDWFLVRARSAPDAYFYDDPDIEPVAHAGKWWLYQRVPSPLTGRSR